MSDLAIAQLIKSLSFEEKIYRNLLEIAENKKTAIIERDLEGIENITDQERVLVSQLRQIEKVRVQTTDVIAKNKKLNSIDVKVVDIINCIDSENSKKLSLVTNNLNDVMKKFQLKNEINEKLLNNALEYIDFFTQLISNTGVSENNYVSSGVRTETREVGPKMLDIKM